MWPPLLGVTADDYGLSPAVNAGIEDAVARGAVTGVSVMMHPGADLERVGWMANVSGIHLVLVEEAPILSSRLLGPLLDRDGRLPRDYGTLFRKIAADPRVARLLRLEAEAQVDRYVGLGLAVRFINSHQHVHLFPLVWRALRPIFARFPDAFVRVAAPGPLRLSRQAMLGLAAGLSRRLSPVNGLRNIDAIGVDFAGRLTVPAASAAFAAWAAGRRRSSAPAELVVHPGFEDDQMHRQYGHWRYHWREEYEVLMSDEFRALVERYGAAQGGPIA